MNHFTLNHIKNAVYLATVYGLNEGNAITLLPGYGWMR